MKLTAFLLLALSIAVCTPKVLEVKTEEEFFNEGHSNKHVVVVFYDFPDKPESKKVISEMLEVFDEDPQFKGHDYRFVMAKQATFERIVKHYNVEGAAGLFYYIENQLQQNRDFGALVEDYLKGKKTKNDVFAAAHSFVIGKHERISKHLKSIDEFDQQLTEHQVMGVYLGKKDSKGHQSFRHLAYNHVTFTFFEVFDTKLAEAIHKQMMKATWDQRDVFLIVRHKSNLTDFDPKEGVKLDAALPYEYFRTFLALERYPKLRNDEHGGDIFMDVFHRHVKLVLHTYDPNTPHSEVQAFEEAVARLPKGMFYANVNTHATWVGHFLQMFAMSDRKMEANKLYFMHASGHTFHIQEFVSEMDEASIYDAVWGVYRKNQDVFNKEERAIMEGDFSNAGHPRSEEEL
jgi:hypothetical protein